jgi:hypothetical protein
MHHAIPSSAPIFVAWCLIRHRDHIAYLTVGCRERFSILTRTTQMSSVLFNVFCAVFIRSATANTSSCGGCPPIEPLVHPAPLTLNPSCRCTHHGGSFHAATWPSPRSVGALQHGCLKRQLVPVGHTTIHFVLFINQLCYRSFTKCQWFEWLENIAAMFVHWRYETESVCNLDSLCLLLVINTSRKTVFCT